MGVVRTCGATLVAVSLAGCNTDIGHEPFVAPTTLEACWQASADMREGSSDALPRHVEAHSTEEHALGTSATIYVCGPAHTTLIVESDVPTGVTVERNPLVVSRSSSTGFGALTVTVDSDKDVVLVVDAHDGEGSGATWSFLVDVEGDQWSFTRGRR